MGSKKGKGKKGKARKAASGGAKGRTSPPSTARAEPSSSVKTAEPVVEAAAAAPELLGAIVEQIAAPIAAVAERVLAAEPEAEAHGISSQPPASTAPHGNGEPHEHVDDASGEESRSFPRVALAVEIGLETESHFFSGLSGDVSEGGVFVQTYRELEVGREVALEFELPSGHVTAHGRVRWHRSPSDSAPPGVGIAFEDLSEEDRSVIHDFCSVRAPLYYDVDH